MDKFFITFNDFFRLCRRNKFRILLITLTCSVLGLFYALSRPVEFKARATFKEKSTRSPNLSSQLGSLVSGLFSGTDNDALTVFKSEQLANKVIKKLHLQGEITVNQGQPYFLKKIFQNLKNEYAHFKGALTPIFEPKEEKYFLKDISYIAETPLVLNLSPENDEEYTVFSSGTSLGKGKFNAPFEYQDVKFTVATRNDTPLASNYTIILFPEYLRSQILLSKLNVEMDKTDKTLIRITYSDPNRQLASKVVNTLMESYQEYLKDLLDAQSTMQLEYLQKRQNDSNLALQTILVNYADSLSKNIHDSGIIKVEKELEFISKNQQIFKEKLINNQLEEKRLQSILTGNCVYFDSYQLGDGDADNINKVLNEKRELQQKRDNLQIALANNTHDSAKMQDNLHTQLQDIEEIETYRFEIRQILNHLNNDSSINENFKILQNEKYLINAWVNYLDSAKSENKNFYRKEFVAYLENLYNYFSVYQKILRERLSNQQNHLDLFSGINLETAKEIYDTYSIDLSDLQKKVQLYDFLIEKLQGINIEVTSLSDTLKDDVSRVIIEKASRLLLELNDEANRSVKEQERLNAELDLQRKFLKVHLEQMKQLDHLHVKLIEDKISSLQNATLDLVHLEISLLDKNLKDYIISRLENLSIERENILQHLKEISQSMGQLPEKMIGEKLIEQNLEINQFIVKELAKMIEAKNISSRLELVQSAPIDKAIAPILPSKSNFLLFATLGGFLGGLSSLAMLFTTALKNGVLASSSNLKCLHQKVAGNLSKTLSQPLKDADLSTLRRLFIFLTQSSWDKKALLIEGDEPQYSSYLADIFAKNNLKVVRIYFNVFENSNHLNLSVSNTPQIEKDQHGDYFKIDGFNRFSTEFLLRDSFKNTLRDLQKNYDWILMSTNLYPTTAEAEMLSTLFSNLVVTVNEETLTELSFYINQPKTHKDVVFITSSIDDV